MHREFTSLVALFAFAALLRGSAFGIVHMPGSSMRPTLLAGDSVFVNRLAYALHVPFSATKVMAWSTPKRGDLVLLRDPGDGTLQLERIIGLPGDRVSLRAGVLRINDIDVELALQTDAELYARVETTPGKRSIAVERAPEPAALRAHFVESPADKGVGSDAGSAFSTLPEFTVPSDRFFCLGDARDDSPAARFHGFVDGARILGRVEGVAYSVRTGPEGWRFRWERILKRVF